MTGGVSHTYGGIMRTRDEVCETDIPATGDGNGQVTLPPETSTPMPHTPRYFWEKHLGNPTKLSDPRGKVTA